MGRAGRLPRLRIKGRLAVLAGLVGVERHRRDERVRPVHLGDENGSKNGSNDKRCMMEARLDGRPPIAVTHQAPTLDQAMNAAAEKLERSIDSMLGRLNDR